MEYSVTKQQLDDNVDKVLEKIEKYKNRGLTEPDAYSLNDIMMDVAFVGADGRNFEKEPYEYARDEKYKELKGQFSELMAGEMPKLIDDEIGLNAQELYDYFEKSLERVASLSFLGDEDRKDSLNIICDAYLYTKKRIRDFNVGQSLFADNDMMKIYHEEVIYDNDAEYYHVLSGLQECLVDSNLAYIYTTSSDNKPVEMHVGFDTLGNKIYSMVNAITNVYGKTFGEIYGNGMQGVVSNVKK